MGRTVGFVGSRSMSQAEEIVNSIGDDWHSCGEHDYQRKRREHDHRKDQHPKADRWPHGYGFREWAGFACLVGHGLSRCATSEG